jgi:hypothetical protein
MRDEPVAGAVTIASVAGATPPLRGGQKSKIDHRGSEAVRGKRKTIRRAERANIFFSLPHRLTGQSLFSFNLAADRAA